ncbi:hypothetical protein [Xanthomonas euroxanthea]|uniref:hypothetical protein n=1 Tax=Xanthomonas euroxanthea TaxID=2259622 RepID=UPI001615D378|nr:hypothetical protein [Xanthomonas euroxanthea]MBB5769131.1 hypothetical protein [Xanthomonas euroxanthea]
MITIISILITALTTGGIGFVAGNAIGRNALRPSLHELAERADAAGMDLDALATEVANQAFRAGTLAEARLLKQWARRLRAAAADHLACINAIQLSDMRAVGSDALVAVSVRDAVAVLQDDEQTREARHV